MKPPVLRVHKDITPKLLKLSDNLDILIVVSLRSFNKFVVIGKTLKQGSLAATLQTVPNFKFIRAFFI